MKLKTLEQVEEAIKYVEDFEHRSMSGVHRGGTFSTVFGEAYVLYEVRSYNTVIYRRLLISESQYHWFDDSYFSMTTRRHQALISRATGVSRRMGTKKNPVFLEPVF